MAQPEEPSPNTDAPEQSPRNKRVVFPWVWIAVIVALRLAVELSELTIDFKAISTLALALLAMIGLAIWYAWRGFGPWPVRLLVAAAPFVGMYLFGSLYEIRFNGAGVITGIHRRGEAKADELLGAVEQTIEEEGLQDWGPGEYDYPRFLGEGPWAEAVGPALATDWEQNPPQEIWRREIGAGWSSFAVYGRYAITQEQRGDEELVVCYALETGEPVWSHADEVRWDPDDFAGNMGRPGPRATPTIVGDRVYTQGATGIVNCLNARTGEVVWRIDTAEEYGTTIAVWGKSGSPLYASLDGGEDALVVVNVGAPTGSTEKGDYDASLVAFDAATGEERWRNGWRQTSYASPSLMELHGEPIILQTSDEVLTGHRLTAGEQLFEHPWDGRSDDRPACSQPISVGENQVLLTKGYGHGSSLLQIIRDGESWSVATLWDPPIKPVLQTKYSNAVVHDGYAYGLNGEMLHCVEIETGKLAWRKRRQPVFGFGQVLLVGDHVLVMCEESGEIVLVAADPAKYREVAAVRVLAEGEVCWNNPVIAGDLLLVRNSVEAAAYRMPLAASDPAQVATKDD